MAATDQTAPLAESTSSPDQGRERTQLEPGQLFGRYLVVDEVGSGGVGSVYAVYDPNLDRRIALKVLRQRAPVDPYDTSAPDRVAEHRLVHEAKALASLSHPNVVTVHDVGRQDDQTYIAMELVEGEDLSSWLRRHRGADWRDTLRVLIDAGKGLAAAHARNVLHRDFKPANVLVGRDGWVRVSDFGLARLVDPAADHGEARPRTIDDESNTTSLEQSIAAAGRIVGTPYYMAPEQLSGEASVRSDIYAFCLSLHEALYEERPFTAATLPSLAAAKLDGPPPPPGNARGVPSVVRRAVQRGLHPDPKQRFGSMAELLSLLERSRARRRTAALPWLLGLTAVGAVPVLMWARADESCSGGEAKLEPVWSETRRDGVRAAFEASDYVLARGSFERTAPIVDDYARAWSDAHREVCEATQRAEQSEELLDRKIVCLDRQLLELRATVEVLQEGQREAIERAPTLAGSLPDLTECVTPRSVEDLGPAQPSAETRRVQSLLAQVDARIRAGLYADADPVSVTAVHEARELGEDRLLADALYRRGLTHNKMGRIADAVEALESSVWTAQRAGYGFGMIHAASLLAMVEGTRAARPEAGMRWVRYAQAELDHSGASVATRAALLGHEASIHDELGDHARARKNYEDAIALLDEAGIQDPERRAGLYDNLGTVTRLAGDFDDAVDNHRRALQLREGALGPEHPHLARTMGNLAAALSEKGQFDEAIEIHERALAIREKVLGAEHLDVSLSLNNLAAVYYRRGDHEQAEILFRRALKIREAALDDDHPKVLSAIANVALVLQARGQLDQASVLYEDSLARLEARPTSSAQLSTVLSNLGNLRAAQGRLDEAAQLYERSLGLDEKTLGPDHPLVAVSLSNLGNIREEQGRHEDARALHERALQIREVKLGPEHPDLIWSLAGIAGSYQAAGDPEPAIALLQRALKIGEATTADPILLAGVRFELAQAIWEVRGDRDGALALVRPARQVFADAGSRPEDLANIEAFVAKLRG